MAPYTTYANGKPFSWSYSKIKNYEVCPKRHWHIDIAKNVKEEESEILAWGNEVHKRLALHLGPAREALPSTMAQFATYTDGVRKLPGKLLVEQKYAISKDFTGCSWFDARVWYRGIGDVVVINGHRAFILDWKLGKILEDSVQLALMAACVFGNYPDVRQVDTAFMWLAHDARTRETFTREKMPEVWSAILPRVSAYQRAVEQESFPATPNGLCRKWCPVTTCPHHGEG